MTSEQFAQIAADFCSQHSFDKPPSAKSILRKGNQNRAMKRPVEDLTEQEQLEKAIRESRGLDVSMDDDEVSVDDDDDGDQLIEIDQSDDEDQYHNSASNQDEDVKVEPPPSSKLKSNSEYTPAKEPTLATPKAPEKPPPKVPC